MIGHLINKRYRIESELGKGGMGAVYRATDVLLERQVAVKVLSKAVLGTEGRARLLQEARAAARLNHPNVVLVFDAGETDLPGMTDPVPYIVMELVEGLTLHKRSVRGLDETIQIAIQICEALDHAHTHGVVHRDVKPDNILITPDGTAKLMDFGLARPETSRLTQAGTIVGTVLYLAPEMALGQPIDGRADLYALGVMLYELTTGEAPFTADDPLAVISQHLHTPPPSPHARNPAVSHGLDKLILHLLRKDPADRPGSAFEVRQALEGLMSAKGQTSAHAEADTQVQGSIARTKAPGGLPPFLKDAESAREEKPVFVARQTELARLHQEIDGSLQGRGAVVFITGGAGRGKSALMHAFARQASDQHADLLVAVGRCNAHTGVGDPYLPFREIMGMLSGDLESRWATGVISTPQARRLWRAVLHTAKALLDSSPNLLNVFVPGDELLERATAAAGVPPGWMADVQALAEREKPPPGEIEQTNLFEQFTGLLSRVARRSPLLLLVDDLQWADAASINLLFLLARRLEGERILVIGAYRGDEVAMGRGEGRHPLEKPLAELKRQFGDIFIDLGEGDADEDQAFVEAYLDSEPNDLGPGFRQALFEHTRGHPLFTIELLRSLQERGDLVLDGEGRWVEANGLDWGELPARVEGVIEERIGRLDEALRETLSAACVAGETFSAPVVARMLETGERNLLRSLNVLEVRHRLVRKAGETQVGAAILSQYSFTHTMFQQFLYRGLSRAERRLLHQQMAGILEEKYGDRSGEISVQLARHYSKAGKREKAVEYLLQAGDAARSAYALQEAIDLYVQALDLLKAMGDLDRAARTLMKLGLTYHNNFEFEASRRAYQEGFALWQRAGEAPPAVRHGPAPHALRLAIGPINTADPGLTLDEGSAQLIQQLFAGLVRLGPGLDILPDCAESWDISDNGRTYLFRLRNGLSWSDGQPLTAADFEFAWKRALDPATRSPVAKWFYVLQGGRAFHLGEADDPSTVGVEAMDDRTLSVQLAYPASYFLQLLAYEATFPVPQHIVTQFGPAWTDGTEIVSNGPFQLRERSEESMLLVRNAAYHGEFRGNVSRVELTLYSELTQAVPLNYGEDALDVLPYLLSFALRSSYGVAEADLLFQRFAGDYVSGPDQATFYVGFNCRQPPFDEVRVRQAFAMTVDRFAIANVALSGRAEPATGGCVPHGIPGHSPDIGLVYDPDSAQKLLEAAGFPGGRGFPETVLIGSIGRETIFDQLAANWQRHLQVEIQVKYLEWAQFVQRAQVIGTIYGIAWKAAFPDPIDFLAFSGIEDGTGWQNAAFDRLVDQAKTVLDQPKRIELYREADRLLMREAPIVPVYYQRFHTLVKPWVKSYQFDRPLKDVVIEPH